eukprot:CAMPEP_0206432234 /NCGR_PEP_ID=MMETSP0324_2-20121206/7805_1 /ASSEMBLY_ACC=CAM_ASM_000836 /TAXON_ID=2866 /ORGANISM="Crypthecodinium cohnii, Strain Seligo" /LENGTH=227 /DNA_ID=CAMNT_0053898247 /DNA_START=317 /DNA_END=1000 /DNA_ORIENTATION=-
MREVPGRAPNQECVGENYIDVHSIGKKTTRYLEFQHSRSPLTTREACKYQKDFKPLPLGDNIINREMADVFKNGLSSGGKVGVDAKMDTRTQAEDDWHVYSPRAIRNANQQNLKPPQELTNTLGAMGSLLETVSHEQRNYPRPNLALAKAERAPQPRPGLEIGGAPRPVRTATAYRRQHGPEQQRLADVMARRSASSPELERIGGFVLNKDPEIFMVKRLPNVMPGK